MIDILPTLNAFLNATCAVLLIIGHRFIKRGNKEAHKKCMLAAFSVSAAFLTSYLTYHYYHGTTRFEGEGWTRPLYFAILGSHTILAVTIVPLAVITLKLGLRENLRKHARLARWTYPLWLYVSVTGVIVYVMLYRM